MNNLEQKIQDHFNKEESKNNLNNLIQKYFIDRKQRRGFLKVLELIKKGEFDNVNLPEYLSDWYQFDIDKGLALDKELFEEILIDIYDELQELYEEKSEQKLVSSEQVEQEAPPNLPASRLEAPADWQAGRDGANIKDLTQKYNQFAQSSVFQNILVAQERVNKQAPADWQAGRDGANQKANIKDEFYSAINSGDKIKVVGILRAFCEQGKLAESFKNDERFMDFFGAYLERHKSEKAKQEFLQSPEKPEYLIEFLQFILQKRLNFSVEESAMIGVGLEMLCAKAGEKEFSEMAFGDENTGKFIWN